MIDHFSVAVKDYSQSLHFYDQTLPMLGYDRVMTVDEEGKRCAGYGWAGKPSFWIKAEGHGEEEVGKGRGVHVAFAATDAASIQRWYRKCLETGGRDNGAPGPRPHYHGGYYAACIVDPNGWRLEAVLHTWRPDRVGMDPDETDN